jgi:FKBP-type peptidyl-prolyl cis-trans isomerase FkpA
MISNKPNMLTLKNIFILILALSLLFVACKKDDKCPYSASTAVATTGEKDYLRGALAADPTVLEDSSGVFYKLTQQGTGNYATICSNMTVKYTGTLFPSGNFFDGTTAANPTANLSLGSLITGWQVTLPRLLKAGGKITLYIPPSLGYGPDNKRDQYGNLVIPGNSYLKFEIEMVNVQ